MARIDDYVNAKNIAVDNLSKDTLYPIAQRSGFEKKANNTLLIPFLNRVYSVSFPEFEFTDKKDSGKEVPIQEQVLILHYLEADSYPISGKWVAYREIPGASFYFSAFTKRAIDPLKNVFGNNVDGFIKAATMLKGKSVDIGDAAFEFQVLPEIPLQLIIHEGDEEFPAEANILFDETIGKMLSPEDVAWLAGMLVYRLMALAG